jgi:DNA-binding response OmpR family regulator
MSPLILVVEDETILGDSICTYLEHHGYTTAVARSGEEGIPLAEEKAGCGLWIFDHPTGWLSALRNQTSRPVPRSS